MYSACLFCHTDLGANEAIEHFPVGRRLAFDAAKGRLWVVCRKCERWNLTPVEERWEAIEECERSYRTTKLRVSTEHIGLARLAEGSELVRIGSPQRPEFAAWRYGDQFGRRRRRNMLQFGAAFVGVAAIPVVGPAIGLSFGAVMPFFQVANLGRVFYDRARIVDRISAPDGTLLRIRPHDINETAILPPNGRESWGLRIPHRKGKDAGMPWWRYDSDVAVTELRGTDAMRAAARFLPYLNRTGASANSVKDAVKIATTHDDPTASFEAAAKLAANKRSWNDYGKGAMLVKMPTELRLALEMVSHEDSERRALEGELYLLEEAWKEAEEIAGISDDMFLPEAITRRLTEMKGR